MQTRVIAITALAAAGLGVTLATTPAHASVAASHTPATSRSEGPPPGPQLPLWFRSWVMPDKFGTHCIAVGAVFHPRKRVELCGGRGRAFLLPAGARVGDPISHFNMPDSFHWAGTHHSSAITTWMGRGDTSARIGSDGSRAIS